MRKKGSPLKLDECCSRQRSKGQERKDEEDYSGNDVHNYECIRQEHHDYLQNLLQYGRLLELKITRSEVEITYKGCDEDWQPGHRCG